MNLFLNVPYTCKSYFKIYLNQEKHSSTPTHYNTKPRYQSVITYLKATDYLHRL